MVSSPRITRGPPVWKGPKRDEVSKRPCAMARALRQDLCLDVCRGPHTRVPIMRGAAVHPGENPQDARGGRVVRRYGCRRCAGYFTQTDEDGLIAVRDVARPEVVQAVPLRSV